MKARKGYSIGQAVEAVAKARRREDWHDVPETLKALREHLRSKRREGYSVNLHFCAECAVRAVRHRLYHDSRTPQYAWLERNCEDTREFLYGPIKLPY